MVVITLFDSGTVRILKPNKHPDRSGGATTSKMATVNKFQTQHNGHMYGTRQKAKHESNMQDLNRPT